MAEAIEVLIKRVCGVDRPFTHVTIPFDGKQAMLSELHGRFAGYAHANWVEVLIVVIDRDCDDCLELKEQIKSLAVAARFIGQRPKLTIRIAVAELETWFLGDAVALQKAYPKLTAKDVRVQGDVEALTKAWERLERPLLQRGYYDGRMPKIRVARRIATHLNLDPGANKSHSFGVFLETLRTLCSQAVQEG